MASRWQNWDTPTVETGQLGYYKLKKASVPLLSVRLGMALVLTR